MFRWLMFLFLPSDVFTLGIPRYECGQHGRFEYCIDGVPGCIVGCHCHPGYYFDTETKICEPNEKLVKDYRRLFKPEPTRVQIPMTPPDITEPLPTPTTKNPLDNQVDAIAKDTDDLGDWLYNQFFKNLETKIENKSTTETPTRRSGGGVKFKETKDFRRRFKSKKKRYRKNDLKRKLLRITEDDSLFDSDSESDESSVSSDSDDTDDTDDSTTKKTDHDSQEHGHKKILVINRKAKPTLPSFIFLPNLETPFFPPIGLPPPMFPMVPVPPMPIPYPYPPPPPLSSSASPPSPHTDDGDKTSITTVSTDATDHTDKPNITTTEPPKPNGTDHYYHRNLQRGHRKKLLRQLQNHIMDLPPQFDHNNHDENEPPDDMDMGESPLQGRRSRPELQDDVKFKYLSQLIHKRNPSKQHEEEHPDDPLPSRRRADDDEYGPIPPPPARTPPDRRKPQDTDDAYYATLGQQIASLIRKIDAKGENVIEPPYHPESIRYQKILQPNIIDNYARLSPRSYWERSVRSPLNHFQNQPVLEGYQRDHENSLFNIESKVEVVATTEYTLSLNEIENVIYLMDKAKSQLQYKIKNSKDQGSLNINLLPRHEDAPAVPPRGAVTDSYGGAQLLPTFRPLLQRKTSNVSSDIINLTRNLHYNLRGILMQNFKNALNNNTKASFSHNRPVKSNNMFGPARNAAKSIQIVPLVKDRNMNRVVPSNVESRVKMNIDVQHPRPPPVAQNRRAAPALSALPVLYALRNVKSFGKKYLEREFTPFQIQSNARHERGGSYFHQELHHFDYFD